MMKDTEGVMWMFSGVYGFLLPFALAMVKSGAVPSGGVVGVLFHELVNLSVAVLAWRLVGYGVATGYDGPVVPTTGDGAFSEDTKPKFVASVLVMLLGVSLYSSTLIGRLKISRYALITTFISLFPYPFAMHWTWSPEGWLSVHSRHRLLSGFCDVNGMGTSISFAGGMTAASIVIVGVRILPEKIPENSQAGQLFLSAHNKLYQGTGVLFLTISLILMNASNMAIHAAAHAMIGTVVSLGTSVLISCVICYEFYGYLDLRHTLHAAISGMVVASTSSPYIPLQHCPVTAACSVTCYHMLLQYNFTTVRVDDPCSVLATYVVPAFWGVLSTGLFATRDTLRSVYPTAVPPTAGLFYSGSPELLASQIIGFTVCLLWGFLWCSAVLMAVKVSIGLDIMNIANGEWDVQEHGGAYCDYLRNYFKVGDFQSESAMLDELVAHCEVTRRHTITIRHPQMSIAKCSGIVLLAIGVAFLDEAAADTAVVVPLVNRTSIDELVNRTEDLASQLAGMSKDMDVMWNLICGTLVFSMQLGFCFLEAGCVRSGSVISIIFKNFADCALGGLCWWVLGYSVAYGGESPFMGLDTHRMVFSPEVDQGLADKLGHFYLSFTYMTTAATIISGAVAERITLQAYCGLIIVVCMVAYPIVVHWVWSDYGWLSPWSGDNILSNGVLDFSGSIVIHLYGGACALTFAYLIGPRKLIDGISVFSPEGQQMVAPHNKFQLATGTLLLWMAWFAFNGGSVVGISNGGSKVAALAIINTLVASGASTLVGLLWTRYSCGYLEISHCCNAALVGLVAITAPCAYISPVYAPVVGIVSVAFYFFVDYIVGRLEIDDVVGAGAVHLGGGLWGGIAVGLFSDASKIRAATGNQGLGGDYGLLLGGGWSQLAVQFIGIVATIMWAVLTTCISYFMLKLIVDIRVDESAEYIGLDISKHHAHSYDY
eukprot:TRINITY_DN2572_c0_g1_i1.p1 TRINITY_DN2572_c0_g1~~TRINITY_DN2572_c0_g1_i1.p1  ORF type:complete len:939 (+),score=192.35 TRINITY_DN2572_c0_g1_i1:177-2993(+)